VVQAGKRKKVKKQEEQAPIEEVDELIEQEMQNQINKPED